MTARVIVVKDDVDKVFRDIRDLVSKDVLIGIPEKNNARETGDVNNATIGYVMETGSPAQNVPARPFLVPGVERAKVPALVPLRVAADAALDGDTAKANQALNAAGIIGMNYARQQISSNIPPPLAPSTVAGRARARGTATRRKNEDAYLANVANGMDPGDAQAAAGITSLVNTGQLRNSITYVVRKREK